MDRPWRHRRHLRSIALSVMLASSAACHKRPPVVPTPPPLPPPAVVARAAPPPPPAAPAPAPVRQSPPLTEQEIFARMSLDELNAKHPLDDVFFAFDQAQLDAGARATLQHDAEWMKKWASTHVLIEGHADERGTNEYNLALGERRAREAQSYLVSLGIVAARIRIVSKGEDAPFCASHDEDCWFENRRGHLVVTAK
jgi:peptidoglycan-associated lipoprotein